MEVAASSGGEAASAAESALSTAGSLVDKHILLNNDYLDLAGLLGVASHLAPAVSGLQDPDYPSSDATVGEMSPVKRVPLPPELVDQFSTMQCNCAMGLFTRVSRAWLTIDSDFFVWNYVDGTDVAFYDQLNETILCVGLVDPKPGIFKPHIRHLLVLITATDILLLGVGFSAAGSATPDPTSSADPAASVAEMHLLPEPLFTLPTDNVAYVSVAGTANGRIFLGGKDNSLTEIDYQAQDGWFTRKCRKINHSQGLLNYIVPAWISSIASDDDAVAQIVVDDSRQHLYTRSAKGVLTVYDLGANGGSLTCVGRLAESSIAQMATNNARTDRSNFKDIVHIAAISRTDSVDAQLLAVTSAGARLFFSTSTNIGAAVSSLSPRPSGLHLIAIRLPPGFTPSASVPRRPANIHAAHSRRGTVLMAQAQNEENDLLWILSGDAFAFEKKLMETQSTVGVEGRIWAMDEIPSPPLPLPASPSGAATVKTIAPPLAVTQHMESPRNFVIVNAQGTHLMTKLRPVDQLRELLLKAGSAHSVLVKRFFQLNSPGQACATALMLACSKTAVDVHVSALAADAFFLYGGETTIAPSAVATPLAPTTIGPMTTPMTPMQGANVTCFNPGVASTPAGSASFLQQPPQQASQSYVAVFSHKHEGLCLYLARLVGPFWNALVAKEVAQGGKVAMTPSFAVEDLAWFLDHLSGLRSFLDVNASLGASASGSPLAPESAVDASFMFSHGGASSTLLSSQKRALTEAALAEKTSLEGIRLIVIATCEALALTQLLAENQLHVLSAGLPADHLAQLKSLTFKALISTPAGRQVATGLIARLVALYLDDNATTDAISAKLRNLCPSLYSADDAVCSKANELIFASKTLSSKLDKDKTLREALALFKSIAGSPSFDLHQVAIQFASVNFFEGIVDLSLAAADKLDPQNLATHCLRNDAASAASHPAVAVRKNCYNVVREILSSLLSARDAASGQSAASSSPSIPASPGPPSPPPPPPSMSAEEAEAAIEVILGVAFKTDEELLHIEIFEWLFAKNMQDRLLQIQSPYLESWLRMCMSRDPNNLAFMNVLWKHYEKMRQFGAAAQILTKLAERSGSQLNLANRMEYLARAAMAAKSGGSGGGSGEAEFLRELEEKIEVARLQLKILEALQNLPATNESKEAVGKLGADLIDISTLYGDYADRFGLADCKLAIIQCAGHYDPKLVESIWIEIFESAMQSATSGEVGDVVSLLQSKLRSLGKEYVSLERYFPVEFLVRYLESISSRLRASPRWVFTTLLDVGIPVATIYPIYNTLFREKDPGITLLHILSAIHQILSVFVSDPGVIGPPGTEARRRFLANAVTATPGYLVELEALTNQTREVVKIVEDFRTLLGQLDKLV